MMLKMKQSIDKKYRQHVAESLNSAFNVHEQQKTIENNYNTIPIGGGSSIPKNYQISKTGRSCGGGHTLTNPHVRFTHLKNLGEMWEEVGEIDKNDDTASKTNEKTTSASENNNKNNDKSEQLNEIQERVEESCQETQLVGDDGHIYRGRQHEN